MGRSGTMANDDTGRAAPLLLAPCRRRLLLGTALGSSLLILSAVPALAASCTLPPSPTPIIVAVATSVTCANDLPRTATAAGDNAIGIGTTGNDSDISITNSGTLTTTSSSFVPGIVVDQPHKESNTAQGIFASTNGIGADITIGNSGIVNAYDNAIKATDGAPAAARTSPSPIRAR